MHWSTSEEPLMTASLGTMGEVILMYENKTGLVCDDNWGKEDADVVCRMMGFRFLLFLLTVVLVALCCSLVNVFKVCIKICNRIYFVI